MKAKISFLPISGFLLLILLEHNGLLLLGKWGPFTELREKHFQGPTSGKVRFGGKIDWD